MRFFPVVTHMNRITQHMSHEEERFLVPTGKPELLAKAVSNMVQNDELATAFRKLARSKVETSIGVEHMAK